jgi:hypothetical protein
MPSQRMVADNYDNAIEVGLSKMIMLIMSTVPFAASLRKNALRCFKIIIFFL